MAGRALTPSLSEHERRRAAEREEPAPATPEFAAVRGWIPVPLISGSGEPLRRAIGLDDPLGGTAVGAPVAAELLRRRGGGVPLPAGLAGTMGEHLGMDLSALRIHADAGAGALARSVQAQAFTHGNDIYFAPGAYRPGSAAGMHTLAHEISHVAAQRTGHDRGTGGPLTVGRADDPAEATADRSAAIMMAALRRTPWTASPAPDGGTVPLTAAGQIDPNWALRRILDGDGKKVTIERIEACDSIDTLTSWRDDPPDDFEEAPTEEEEAAIKKRLKTLGDEAAERRAAQYRAEFETAAGLSDKLTNFDGGIAEAMLKMTIGKKAIGLFFKRCADETVAPSTLYSEICGISADDHPRRFGLTAFAAGATAANAKAIATIDASCLADVGEDFDVAGLLRLLEAKVLTFTKNTYRITKGTGANGAIYRFELAGGQNLGPIGAEWHAHFGIGDKPENPGFKHKSKGKQSWRLATPVLINNRLKAAFGDKWGVKV